MGQIPMPLSRFTRTLSFSSSGQATISHLSAFCQRMDGTEGFSNTGKQRRGLRSHQHKKRQASDATWVERQSALPLPHPSPAKAIWTDLISPSFSCSPGKLSVSCLLFAGAWSNWTRGWKKIYVTLAVH